MSVGSGETIAQLETAGWRLEVEAAELWEEAHAEHHAARDGGDDREVHEEGVTVLEQQRLILTVAQDRERMQRLVAAQHRVSPRTLSARPCARGFLSTAWLLTGTTENMRERVRHSEGTFACGRRGGGGLGWHLALRKLSLISLEQHDSKMISSTFWTKNHGVTF